MKKLFTLYTGLLILAPAAFGQKEVVKRPQAIGISFFLTDFTTAERIRTTSLNQVISDKRFASFSDMTPGLALTYFKGVANHVDVAGTLAGSFVRYPMPNRVSANDRFLLEATAVGNIKLTTEKYWVQPYLTAGIGAHKYGVYYGAFLPMGIGFKVNFFDEAHLFLNTTYRVPVTTETANYHFQHGIGIAGIIGSKKKEAGVIPTPPPPTDTDGDGLSDVNDKCPTERGMVRYGGCPVPDTDKDGLNDEIDKCATVQGLARYDGCPVPDTDKDGINDEEDKCPNAYGVARYQGCAVPDKDQDGVNDEDDKCADVRGDGDNFGCPSVSADVKSRSGIAAKSISFAGNTSNLSSASQKALDDIARLMVADKKLSLTINVHTNNAGGDDKNLTLSQKQAASIKSYLLKKGILENRVTALGHGKLVLVADNSENNHRTELTLSYYR